MFDWCLRARHSECRKEFERFYVGTIGRGRNKKQGVIYTEEIIKCRCTCHRKDK